MPDARNTGHAWGSIEDSAHLWRELQTPDTLTPPGGSLDRAVARLRQFVSPPLVDVILRGDDQALRSHRGEVTVAFLDLRGFTAFTETADPEEVMAVLHDYHHMVGQLVRVHGGMVERFAGDGVMVFFNDPVPVPDPQRRAVAVALGAHERMAALLDRWRRRGASLHLGIGISHGFATVGLVGSEDRWDYAAIGPVTNLAARLCARARAGETLVCERVMSALGLEVVADLVGTFRLRGFRRPHKVFRVCDLGTTEGRAPGAKVRR